MNVFIDTNIIIDVLDQREKFFEASSNILSLGAENKIELYATALTMANCIYILRKPLGYDGAVAYINTLFPSTGLPILTPTEFLERYSFS